MTITCKGAVLRTIGLPQPYAETTPLTIETIHLAPPKPVDVVVKVMGAGLCHSDLSVINGDRGRDVPMVMGHEGAGEVVEVGSAVTDLRVGDHVAFQFSVSCGRCRTCLAGRPNICEAAPAARSRGELLSGGSRITDADGRPLRHQAGVSCFAEYAVVHRGSVVVIDDDLSLTKAAVFGCAVMTGVGAVVNTAGVRPGQAVAVYGLGGVGLSGVMGARVAGAGTIVAVDPEPAKLEKARSLGATHCFDARDPDLDARIREATTGGVDCALDCAGAIPAGTHPPCTGCRGRAGHSSRWRSARQSPRSAAAHPGGSAPAPQSAWPVAPHGCRHTRPSSGRRRRTPRPAPRRSTWWSGRCPTSCPPPPG